MAIVKPFSAIRPAASAAKQVAALPYDVYNRKEACDIVSQNPLSFLAIDRAETQFEDSVHTYDPRVYQKANELLQKRIQEGIFITDSEQCYYIYEQTMNQRTQTGLVACCSIDDYANGVIRRHENTRAEKEADRIHHVDACNAQTGPIFLAYRSNSAINEIIYHEKQSLPIYDFLSDDGIRHTVWKVSNPDSIHRLEVAFQKISHTYIADGHHRAASAVHVGFDRRIAHPNYTGQEEFNYFLSVLFPDDELFILPYNRVVKDLAGLTTEQFLSILCKKFLVTAKSNAVIPSHKGSFGMFLNNQWYQLDLLPQFFNDDPIKGLDVSLLNEYILFPILKIGDLRTDQRIDFIGGIRGTEELERRCHTDMKVAFSMYPTSIQELFAVADSGKFMPPKSTWFEPKLRSGLFIHSIQE